MGPIAMGLLSHIVPSSMDEKLPVARIHNHFPCGIVNLPTPQIRAGGKRGLDSLDTRVPHP
jgi:hypothetical protein